MPAVAGSEPGKKAGDRGEAADVVLGNVEAPVPVDVFEGLAQHERGRGHLAHDDLGRSFAVLLAQRSARCPIGLGRRVSDVDPIEPAHTFTDKVLFTSASARASSFEFGLLWTLRNRREKSPGPRPFVSCASPPGDSYREPPASRCSPRPSLEEGCDRCRAGISAIGADYRSRFSRPPLDAGLRLQTGIGITTGVVLAGNVGSERRMHDPVVGDPVNVASRPQGAAGPGQILLDETTHTAVEGLVPAQDLGGLTLAGMGVTGSGPSTSSACVHARPDGGSTVLTATARPRGRWALAQRHPRHPRLGGSRPAVSVPAHWSRDSGTRGRGALGPDSGRGVRRASRWLALPDALIGNLLRRTRHRLLRLRGQLPLATRALGPVDCLPERRRFRPASSVAIWNTRPTEFGRELVMQDNATAYGGALVGTPAVAVGCGSHTSETRPGSQLYRAATSRSGPDKTSGAMWSFASSTHPQVGLVAHGGAQPTATAAFDYLRFSATPSPGNSG